MKYINKREDFLKKSKHDKIERLIKEGAGGPFTNDIPWGDSLVGRLINAVVRKSGIAINVTRIKSLIPRLKELFEEILEDSKISQQSMAKVWKVKVYALLQKLKRAVDEEEEVNILIYITDDLINIVNSEFIDDENRKTLLEELKKFKEFLLSLKDDSVEEEKEEEEVKPVSTNSQEIPFDFCIKNLKAVYAILVSYRKLKDVNKQEHIAKKDAKGNPIVVGKEYNYNGKTVKVINIETHQLIGPGGQSGDGKWLTNDDKKVDPENADTNVFVTTKDSKTGEYTNKTGQEATASKLVPITESVVEPTTVVKDATPAQPKQNSILNSVKPVYTFFTSDKDIFPGLESLFKMSPENQQKYGFKAPILKIYNTARLNEDLKQFLTRPEAIGKLLITMYKSTKVKEDGSFEGIQDDMKLAIADFNKTMKNILLFQSGIGDKSKKEDETEVKPEESKPEAQTKKEDDIDFDNKNRSQFEGRLLKYNSFISINEADEAVQGTQTQSEPVQGTQSQSQVQGTQSQVSEATTNVEKIKEYFEANVNYKIWMVEESEFKTIETDIENESKDNKELIINGIDPIIEILKLFNRAYKLHTTNNIPGGRSGGAVSRSVYNEYTPFGQNSSGQSGISDGPYRNNKIFNVWEDAVLDIMKQRKYQPIFSKETKIRIGNQLIKGAGSTFKKLITGLLDTETLYKNGAQKKFLNEYFGPDAVPEGITLGLPGDEKTNADNAGNIKTTELEFVKNSDLITNEDIKNKKFENKLLQIKYTGDDKTKTIYMFIEGVNGEFFNVSYCNSFYFFNNYIKTQGGESPSLKLENINISKEAVVNQEVKKFVLRYTKISKNDLSKLLTGTSIQLNSVTTGGETSNLTIKPSLVSWLVNSADKSLYSIKDVNRLSGSKRIVGGELNVPTLLSKKYGDDQKFDPLSKAV